MNAIVLNNPLIQHKLSIIRNKKTGTKEFREIIGEIATFLCYEAMADATLEEVEIETPICKTKGKKYANVKITWKKNTNAVKYYVYRRMVGKSSYTHIATTTAAKYTDKNKKKGKKYYYKIK